MNQLRSAASLAFIAATLLAGAVTAADAATDTAPPDRPTMSPWPHEGVGGHFRHVLDQLNLTEQQQQQVRDIFAEARPRLEALRQGGRANREQLAATPPTDPGYAGLVASAKTNAAEHIQLMSDLWTRVYSVLTPEQRTRIPGIVAAERASPGARGPAWRTQRGQ